MFSIRITASEGKQKTNNELEEKEKSGKSKYGITASLLFFFLSFFFYYLFIRLHRVLVAARGIFVALWDLCCTVWDL